MKRKLYVIGNGLDIAHNLPTRFDPDFKNIALKYESEYFWDLYQSRKANIWSDFENLLGHPDFNNLEEIFQNNGPDYASDRESDRDGIINQVWINGYLAKELNEFANVAEENVHKTKPIDIIKNILDENGYYITMNYTHTLESVYNIPQQRVLHIHGEVGKNNLILGYPEGNFEPEKYNYDVRQKGRGPYRKINIEDFISTIEDNYTQVAYTELYNKCKLFSKKPEIGKLQNFLDDNHCEIIDDIIIYGHSCAIDYDYFHYLNRRYKDALWVFYVKGKDQEANVLELIKNNSIINNKIIFI